MESQVKRPRRKKQDPSYIPQVYTYLRCSTDKQDLESQQSEIKKYCLKNNLIVHPHNVFEDEATSGYKVPWRKRKIADIINKLQKGDIVLTYDLTRLGRKLYEICEVAELIKNSGCILIGIVNNLRFSGDLADSLQLQVFAMAAQIERNLISQRTKSGIQAVRENKKLKKDPNGNYVGVCGQVRVIKEVDEDGKETKKQVLRKGTKYKSKYTDRIDEIVKLFEDGMKRKDISVKLQIPYPTICVMLKGKGKKKVEFEEDDKHNDENEEDDEKD